jgi:sugar phosphate isomerase/epimerase
MDQILFATYTTEQLAQYRSWTERLGVGLEVHVFADPALLACNGSVAETVATHERILAGYRGVLGFHGAFYDMVSASVDPAVVALTRQRYRQNLEVAARLGGQYVVYHANYMGGLKLANYRHGWHERQVQFWGSFAEEAARMGIYILLENMWADDPTIISHVLEEVNNPYLRACLDVSHACLFSKCDIHKWIQTLAPMLHVCHLNNTDGELDMHWPLGQGLIDYPSVLQTLRQLQQPPLMTLEMQDRGTIDASLPYLDLVRSS